MNSNHDEWFIHYKRPLERQGKTLDSMRMSANLERINMPIVLFLDEPQPFSLPHFSTFIQSLSSRLVREFWMSFSFEQKMSESDKKNLERAKQLLANKNIPLRLVEVAHPKIFHENIRPESWEKKQLFDQHYSFVFFPFVGQFAGRHFPEGYSAIELAFFEMKIPFHPRLFVTTKIETDEFVSPMDKLQRFGHL